MIEWIQMTVLKDRKFQQLEAFRHGLGMTFRIGEFDFVAEVFEFMRVTCPGCPVAHWCGVDVSLGFSEIDLKIAACVFASDVLNARY